MDDVVIKKCIKCKKDKTVNEFYKNKTFKDDLDSSCKECKLKYQKKYQQENAVNIAGYKREYRESHKDKINLGLKKRRDKNPAIKLNDSVSVNIRQSLQNNKHGRRWEGLVGYTCSELMKHLEKQFTEGMAWQNYGWGNNKWNIDHIIPISSFNITSYNCKGFKDCWALDNLQPLWHVYNMEKGNKPMESKYLIKPKNLDI